MTQKGNARRRPRKSAAPPAPSGPPRNSRIDRERIAAAESAPGRRRAPRVPLRVRIASLSKSARALAVRLRRPAWIAARAMFVVAACVGAVAVGRLIERHVRTSPSFATKDIGVSGASRLTRDEVLHTAGLRVGQNVFDISPEEAEARLRDHPWIAWAEVRRRLPGTYELKIRERTAVAVLLVGTSYLVSSEGVAFKRLGPGDPVDLPVVTGIDHDRLVSDRAFRASILLEIVAMLHDYRGAGLWRSDPIGEIHVEPDDGLSLYVGEDATFVRLGRGPFRQKLRRLRVVFDRLRARRAKAAYVYLDNVRRPDRATVRLR